MTTPNGGIRSIAPGNNSDALQLKAASEPLVVMIGEEFHSFSSATVRKEGVKARGVRRTHIFLANQTGSKVFLKVDVPNALNCLRRVIFLSRIREKMPSLYKLLWQECYQLSKLFFGEHIIESSEGNQQGDPFGPTLFYLSVYLIAKDMLSDFKCVVVSG